MAEPRPGFPAVRFQLLGPLRAWRDGVEVDLGAAKQRAVLAVLLLEVGRPLTTTRIIDAVWPDRPPKNGPNVVQKYVAGLRRALDPFRSPRSPGQVLGSSDAGYVLHAEAGGVDVAEFARLVREAEDMRRRGLLTGASAALRDALALWHAEPLAGLAGPVFDAARDRLAADRADAFERWADVEIALGHQADVVPELARTVTAFPLRERLRYLLVLALYRSGRQAEALAAYHDACRYLDDELGVEPGERLRALHLAILRGEPARDENMPAAAPAAPLHAGQVPSNGASSAPVPAGVRVQIPHVSAAATAAPPPLQPAVPGPVAPGARVTDRGAAARPWRRIVDRLVAGLIPFLSFGLASWAVLAFFAARRRSLHLALAAVGYFALIALFFVAVGQGDDTADVDAPWTAMDVIGMLSLLVAWLGGTVHAVLAVCGLQHREEI